MYKTTEQGTRKVCVAIGKALMKQGTLLSCREAVSAVLGGISWMDVRMKADVAREAEALARKNLVLASTAPWKVPSGIAYGLNDVMKAFNRAYKKAWKRTAKTYIGSQLKLQRGREEPVVFYLVSSHQHPQPAHEPLQGTVLIDRYWNVATGGDQRIEGFLKTHKMHTVQWAMGAPHYLISRPNCRHYLIPLRTDEVVSSTLKQIKAMHQRKPTNVRRPITDKQRWVEYKALRVTVLNALMKYAPKQNRIGAK